MLTVNRTRLGVVPAILLCFVSSLYSRDKKSRIPLFKVNAETVLLRVSVTDSRNRLVTGIKKSDFQIYEDGVLQTITNFSQESGPVSMGFVLDVSYSMKYGKQLETAKNLCRQILERDKIHPEDEYFLISFNEATKLLHSFSSEISDLQERITFLRPEGNTALRDAIYLGINRFKACKNERKALVLITDGLDNSSRYSKSEIREYATESSVQIYTIPTSPYGLSFFNDLARLTGGRVGPSIEQIHNELRHQYLLGYTPSNKTRDGAWRQIKVKVDTPPGFPKLSVRTKDGYYAPEN
jgi:Ca-activated chloride channel family protein